jgi:hypothetical protein
MYADTFMRAMYIRKKILFDNKKESMTLSLARSGQAALKNWRKIWRCICQNLTVTKRRGVINVRWLSL